MHRIVIAALAVPLAVSLTACGSSGAGSGDGLVFGESTEPCAPIVLTNDTDDETKVRDGSDCLLAAVESGEAVIWDVLAVTVEGDPIPVRYASDGDVVVITDDSTRDEFGNGTVEVRRCATIERGSWLPEGRDCVGTDGPGFDDATLP